MSRLFAAVQVLYSVRFLPSKAAILAVFNQFKQVYKGVWMSFLSRDRSVAGPGYSRWLVPPAALAIHLSIGQIYAYSVFSGPLHQLVGVTEPAPGDWSIATIGWIFTIAIAVLGAAAALFGKWLERVGPRMAMFVSACCFGGGFLVAAYGVSIHNIWVVYLGNGVLGGIGLGLGYISPVSTLIKWFPDRPGLATGMAIMGFGGGAMIASPLSVALMNRFSTATSVGVAPTLFTLGIIYFVFMMFGVFTVRVPPEKLETCRLRRAHEEQKTYHQRQRRRRHSRSHAAVLAAFCGALLKRYGGYRGARAGFGNDSRDVFRSFGRAGSSGDGSGSRRICRLAQFVQYGRPLFLGVGVGLYRP